MGFRVGVEVGSATTSWTVAEVDDAGRRLVVSGRMPSVVAPVDVGVAAGAEVPADAPGSISGFVDRLGDAEPMMVGGVPYGVESLVGAQLATVMRTASSMTDARFDYVVVAHADGLDDYHVGLWREAARVAGVPMVATVTVEASVATETLAAYELVADPDLARSAGASVVRLATDRDPLPATGVRLVDVAASVAASAGAASAIGVAGVVPAGETVTAIGPTAGPVGVPLGPAGPSGVPLAQAGPGGVPAGPSGTPLTVAGPAGTPIGSSGAAPSESTATGVTPQPSRSKGWKLPHGRRAVLAGGAAAVVVVGTVGIVAATRGGGEESTAPPRSEATAVTTAPPAATSPAATPATTAPGATTPASTDDTTTTAPTTVPATTSPAVIDVTPVLGTWLDSCDPYLAGDGASGQIETVSSPGPGLLDLVIQGADYTSTDCTGAAEIGFTLTVHMEVTAEGTVDGVQAFATTLLGEPECVDDFGGAACAFVADSFGGMTEFGLGIDSAGLLRLAAGIGPDGLPSGWMPAGDGATRL